MSPKQLTSWSSSRFNTYDQCAAKAKYAFLDKLPQPSAPPLDRGNIIHKQAECFIKGLPCPVLDETKPLPRMGMGGEFLEPAKVKYHKLGVLPPELASFADYFAILAKRYKNKLSAMTVEGKWAFRKDWTKTVGTDWTGCWLRVNVDAAYEDGAVLYIDDWKTGKYNADLADEYKRTLQLYAMGAFLWLPHIKKVRPRLRYTDLGVSWPETDGELEYTRADLPKLKALWLTRVTPMLADTVFAPKPNSKCKWCPFSVNFIDRVTGKPMPVKGPCPF